MGERDVLISSGAVDLVNAESYLAAILGHELAHVLLGHGRESTNRNILQQRWLLLWTPILQFGVLLIKIGTSLSLFTPEAMLLKGSGNALLYPTTFLQSACNWLSCIQEAKADFVGVLLMAEAGYDTSAAITMLETLGNQKKQQLQTLIKNFGVENVPQRPRWTLTHPLVSPGLQSLVAVSLS